MVFCVLCVFSPIFTLNHTFKSYNFKTFSCERLERIKFIASRLFLKELLEEAFQQN